MELKVTTLDGKAAGSVELKEAIFGLAPRPDILQRCVNWQLAKRQAGTHKVKNRSEINRTGKKLYRQKGTGNARHGSARANIFRGGGRAFGPLVRSHAIDLPMKVRAQHPPAGAVGADEAGCASSPPYGTFGNCREGTIGHE